MDSLELTRAEFYWLKFWKFWTFLLPAFDFHAYGEQKQEKGTSCPFKAVLYSLQKWDSWLCDLKAEVRVKQRPCNPQVHLWGEQQKQFSLSICKNFFLCSFFLCCTAWFCQFSKEYLLTLPSPTCCTQVWIGPAGYCFRVL